MNKQHAIILRLVQIGAIRKYEYLLRPEYFNDYYREIYSALITYELTFGHCMSAETFRTQWPDYEWYEVGEDVEWIADELKEDFLEARGGQVVDEFTEALQQHPSEAIKIAQQRLLELQPYTAQNIRSVGLFAHRLERAMSAQRRGVIEGLSGITTGFSELDEVTSGTHEAEIELYCARPGNCKSLMLLYGAYSAFADQGKRVSVISPEMTAYEFGLRLDSFHLHISSMRVQEGKLSEDELAWYREKASDWRDEYKGDIMFYEPAGRGRFTTADIRAIIAQDAPDLILLDGILLADPMKEWRDARQRLLHLMDELKEIVTQTKVAFRAAHQVNRESERNGSKRKADVENAIDMIPELHQLAESGATEQYANRVYCMKKYANRLYIAVRKNRNAPEGRIFSFNYDIDRGYMTDIRLEGDEAGLDTKQTEMPLADDEGYGF